MNLIAAGTDWVSTDLAGEILVSLRAWFDDGHPVSMIAELASGKRFDVALWTHRGYLEEMTDPEALEEHEKDYGHLEDRELLPGAQKIKRITCRRDEVTELSIVLEDVTVRFFERVAGDDTAFAIETDVHDPFELD